MILNSEGEGGIEGWTEWWGGGIIWGENIMSKLQESTLTTPICRFVYKVTGTAVTEEHNKRIQHAVQVQQLCLQISASTGNVPL